MRPDPRASSTAVWRSIAILVLLALTMTGCGTAVVENRFAVTLDDPSGVLGADPVAVSVFDPGMGASDEWARRSIGVVAPGQPYTTSFNTTTTRVLGDSSPPERVELGLALPDWRPSGHFGAAFTPVDGQTQTVTAPFVGYFGYDPTEDGEVEPVDLSITSRAGDLTWEMAVQVRIRSSP